MREREREHESESEREERERERGSLSRSLSFFLASQDALEVIFALPIFGPS